MKEIYYNFVTEHCGSNYAYHSGDMVNDNAQANTKTECQDQCARLSSCKFWDLGEGFCRLRSNSGTGKEPHSGYFYGSKNCIFV